MTNSGMYPDDGVIATELQLSHYQIVIEKEPWWQQDELCVDGIGDQSWLDDLRYYYIGIGRDDQHPEQEGKTGSGEGYLKNKIYKT